MSYFNKPLSPQQEVKMLHVLAKASTDQLVELTSKKLTYDEARQLCHAAGIRRIKGNCRKVLARRIVRLNTIDRTGRLNDILRGTNA